MEHKIAVVLLLVIAVFAVVGLYMISAEPKVVTQTVPVNVPVVMDRGPGQAAATSTSVSFEIKKPTKPKLPSVTTGLVTMEFEK